MRVNRRVLWLLGLLAIVAAGGIGLLFAPRWLVPFIAVRGARCTYFGPTTEPSIALTIDDGPDARTTPRVVDLLASHGARATFFLISSRIAGNEDQVRAMVRNGNELGNHLTRDEPSIRLSPVEFEAALQEADAVLRQFGPVRWVRPGGGWYNARMVAAIEKHGFGCALGSVYPYDASLPSVAFATTYILAHVRPGAIVVLHDGGDRGVRTAAILERVLPALRARGYRAVTLSELVNRSRSPAPGE